MADVAHLVHAPAAAAQALQRLGDEAGGAAVPGAVAVGGVLPVGGAQRRLVGAVDAAAVAVQALADRLAIEQGLQLPRAELMAPGWPRA